MTLLITWRNKLYNYGNNSTIFDTIYAILNSQIIDKIYDLRQFCTSASMIDIQLIKLIIYLKTDKQ